MKIFHRFLRHCEGATAIEYSLIAAGIALAIIAIVITLGGDVFGFYGDFQAKLAGGGAP